MRTMRNLRYMVAILDARGRRLYRTQISSRTFRSLLGASLVSFVLGVSLGLHGLSARADAEESRLLAAENRELQGLQAEILGRLPAARERASHAELTFAQLWGKSGLGPEPTALGVGPLERTPAADLDATPFLRSFDLENVPMELDRMSTDYEKLQTSLGELLEYFHDAERLLSNTPSIKPAHTLWETSAFGRRRDPITSEWLMHKGIDLAGAIGDPIFAPADGVVIFTGQRGGYGLLLVIDHGYGLQTHFAHLSRTQAGVGDHVRRGQLIANMGTSGKSTGPHVHYEVRRMGHPIDPSHFIMD